MKLGKLGLYFGRALVCALLCGCAQGAPREGERVQTDQAEFRVETVVTEVVQPWSMAFLPGGDMLVLEKVGRLRLVRDGELVDEAFAGLPPIAVIGQGGLLDVELDPQYAENGWVYLVFSVPVSAQNSQANTTVVRCRLDTDAMQVKDLEVLYRPPEATFSGKPFHFGSRVVFDHEGWMYFSIGDRGDRQNAQSLNLPNGKIYRLHRDGRVPADNPFVDEEGVLPEIYSYGHRNPQGLAVHPETGDLWAVEHGPRGGDELNLIRKGKNYGWPAITYGINYNGTPITDQTEAPGMEQPVTYWTPSIAPCGMGFYTGDRFPEWKHDLFVTALAHRKLTRLEFAEDGRTLLNQEIMLEGIGRIRDFETGPDGHPYLVLNAPNAIVRLVPAGE